MSVGASHLLYIIIYLRASQLRSEHFVVLATHPIAYACVCGSNISTEHLSTKIYADNDDHRHDYACLLLYSGIVFFILICKDSVEYHRLCSQGFEAFLSDSRIAN